MAGKRWDAMTPRPKYDGGTWWLRVGSAWVSEEGRTTIYLDSYPIPDKEGVVKIMLFEPLDRTQPRPAPKTEAEPRNWSKELDDEIPF